MKFVAERELRAWIVENDRTELVATFDLENEGRPTGLYAELHSYDSQRMHLSWEDLAHKRVRITVETVD